MSRKRKSSVDQLPEPLRDVLEQLLKENRYTLDEITEHMRQLGAGLSRSAIGRFSRKMDDELAEVRQVREVASYWGQQLKDNPEGDVGRLLIQMLQTVARRHIGDLMGPDAKTPNAMELMLLGKALQSTISAEKMSAERELKIRDSERKRMAEELQKKVQAETGDTGGTLTTDRLNEIVREVYGVGSK